MKFYLRILFANIRTILFSKSLTGKFAVLLSVCAVVTGLIKSISIGFGAEIIVYVLRFCVRGLVFWLLFIILLCAIVIAKDIKLNKILSEKGFCPEYLNLFYEKRIKDKPVNNQNYIHLAEIHRKMGDYASAINILNNLKVPDSPDVVRSLYLFMYISIALKKGDSTMADDIWRKNQDFINKNINNDVCSIYLNLALIYADCAAGRYERALDICLRYLDSYESKIIKNSSIDFYVLKFYILKKLGREEEANKAVMEFNEKVKSWNPLIESSRAELRRDVERAMRGELPV